MRLIYKSFLSIILCVTAITVASSQNYRVFEWDVIGISSLNPINDTVGNAIGLHTEARLNLNDKISLGLKLGWQFFDGIHEEPLRGMGITNALALTSDYYILNNNNRRAFVGLAIGSFNNSATTEMGDEVGGSGLGIVPRIGCELGFFLRVTGEYNYTLEDDFPNYFALGLALNIGGRRK